VGADGGRSAVRKALAIPFPGETREDERFLIADVEAPALDHDYWHNWSVGGDAVLRISMCPLPKTACFQFVAPIMPGSPEPDLMLDTLQRLLEARSGRQDIALTKLMWVTLHRTNLRLAARYREGSVFLAGDAAHAPPQAGGQGLNISVQDAVNLSWKLAAALNGAPDALLGSYGAERRAVAAAKLGLLSAELQATGQCNAVEAERRQLAIKEDIFHLELNYRSSPLVREARCDVQGVQAGDRAPDALTFDPSGQSMRLFDLFRGPQSTLLAFSQDSASVCADALKDQRAEIRLHVIDGTVEAPVHEIYGVKAGASTILLVRPDGYIGLAADSDLRNELLRYCAGVFGW
jgi:hypothetical protein